MADASRLLRFGTDGVRAPAAELDDDFVSLLGRAAAHVLGPARFLVARDTRESGPRIEAALVAGLLAEGSDADRLGVLPTPGLAHLAHARALPGAMISASHNPFGDNGIKLFGPGGRKLADELESRIEAEMERLAAAGHEGSRSPDGGTAVEAPHGEYVDHLERALEGSRLDGLSVVVDCAHGAAYEVAPEILERLGATVTVLAADPDGRNINEECGSTHPGTLQARVVAEGADAGLAFDGDADRLIAVDETGNLIDGDHYLGLVALDLRERGRLRHDTLVTTVMANLGLRQAMQAHGVEVVETKVGDRYVLEAMIEGGFSLGGEQSGHVIFADLATTGDGILSGIVLLDVMRRSGRALSELAGVVTKLPQVLENVRVADRDALDDAGEFWAAVEVAEADLGDAGRVLVRPSGTEPVVRVMVEAPTEDAASSVAAHLVDALRAALGESAARP